MISPRLSLAAGLFVLASSSPSPEGVLVVIERRVRSLNERDGGAATEASSWR